VKHAPAAGQAIAALGQAVEVRLAQAPRATPVAADVSQQPAKALASERRLADLAAAKGRPQLRVDALVGRDRGGRTGQSEGAEGLPEGRAFGAVEVEQGVVDVEEDGAQAGQVTWRGR
jgi:hypothetical protein